MTSEQSGFVPCGGQCRHKVLHLLGLHEIAFRFVSPMQQRRLKEHRQCEFVGMGSDMLMLRVGEGAGSIVHRSNHIACEWQRGIVGSSLRSEGGVIIIPLRSIYSLYTYEVGICALPTSWNCRAVEVDHQMMACGTFEKVDTIFHRLLFVACKEVDLHSCHTHLLKPCKLTLTVFGSIESLMRSWCTPSLYPCCGRVIPQYGFDSFFMSITYGILYVAAVFHLVPFRIDEYVRPVHLHCHINILPYYLIVIRAMIICPIYPRYRTWFNPRSVLDATRLTDIGDKC